MIFLVALLLGFGGDHPPITPENTSQVEILHRLQIVGSYATELAFNPIVPSQLAVAQADGFVSLWDANSGQQITSWQAAEGAVSTLAYTADGQYLITGGNDGTLTAWDMANQQSAWSIQSEEYAPVVLDTAANNIVAVGYTDGIVRVWSTHTGEHFFNLYGYNNRIQTLDLSEDGTDIAFGYHNQARSVFVYEIVDAEHEQIYLTHILEVYELNDLVFFPFVPSTMPVTFISDTVLLAVANFSAPQFWDLRNTPSLDAWEVGPYMAYPSVLSMSTAGSLVALAGNPDVAGGGCGVTYCPILLIAGMSEQIDSIGEALAELSVDNNEIVTDVVFSHDDRFFASTTLQGSLTIWGIDLIQP